MQDIAVRVEGILEKLEGAYFDIPFENSDFQNRHFVMAAQQTPARAYRAIGLRMFSKIRAVKEYLIGRQLADIDIEEFEYKINRPETSEFDRRRFRLEIIKIQESRKWSEKLLNDAIHELDVLYAEFQTFPQYTREEFEREEQQHFDARLTRQLKAGGAQEALLNIHEDMAVLGKQLAAIEHKE